MVHGSPVADDRRTVLLTGATGNWGRATLRAFRDQPDIVVRAFALATAADRAVLAGFADMENLELCFGDLTRYDDVVRAIDGVDVVLHVAAVVSPLADANPGLARRVNVGSIQNIIRAVAALPDPRAVAVVGVGSVAETGDRPEPCHWGRVGDPIRVSQFDEYGQTKVIAEKLLVDSGLPRWVWLRQTGIFHPAMLEIRDPIMTHSPFTGVMEWVSVEDAARLLIGVCAPDVPEEFWQSVYNIGGGEGWRLTNWELQTAISGAMGVRDVRRWYDRNWFATGNFHGQWYSDSDRLEEMVPFRRDSFDAAMARAVATLPPAVRNAGRVPAFIVKHMVMRPITRKPRGTMHAITRHRTDEIAAHFGSYEAWRSIGGWSTFEPPAPSRTPAVLDHGYDEEKPPGAWGVLDYAQAAAFRGGALLSDDAGRGRPGTPLVWRCAFGHVFAGSPRLILTAGHWCPECVRDSSAYALQAEKNRFLAQLDAP
ncbi:NAD(P)-dependent oxidoreductase [Microbacterium sp. zg-Y818]|uniref:NAD-dependent epimerase/dehydratase family protein n=1 Tax=unclassified Microbacterium TaxID=2609290 RepID=UPI00214AF016|nr:MULTISPECIES: NAD(P)-dependent oxidoreductase [unclassified Microbacterium]MCR2799383.1 NAD(P)-dependent oxidoreductase [Microbacterium sp. zg.Y818]WIM21382.1 NAD(P)-dependent oxidoreductase [Microbacterium sp. zg-Y818]